jgi:hypothetical protein
MRKVKHRFIFETDAEALALKLQTKGISYQYERGYDEFVVTHELDIEEKKKHGNIYLSSSQLAKISLATGVRNKFAINNALSVSVQRELGLLYGP